MKLFTYGYLGGSLADLRAYVAAGATILDTRLVPQSRVPYFRRSLLERELGRYVWQPALGNLNYKVRGGPIELANWPAGWITLRHLLDRGPTVLLCACREARTCHRSTIATLAQIERPELQVIHLAPGDRFPEGDSP